MLHYLQSILKILDGRENHGLDSIICREISVSYTPEGNTSWGGIVVSVLANIGLLKSLKFYFQLLSGLMPLGRLSEFVQI